VNDDVKAIAAALARPFDPRLVKWKPSVVKGNRCLAMAYIDARTVMERLDDVLGVENWQDRYTLLPDRSVVCRLRLKLGGEWVGKSDVGNPSERPDEGDRLKAAFSDALKRAAVKFGVGRYLYRLTASWVDFDPVKKQIAHPPQLPAWALPNPPAAKVQATAVAANPYDSLVGVGFTTRATAARPTSAPDPETAAERAAIEAEGEDPAVMNQLAFAALLTGTATSWPDARSWINAHLPGAAYTPGTKYFEVLLGHRRALVAELRRKPGGDV